MAIKLVCFLVCLIGTLCSADELIVNITDGQVRGTQAWSFAGNSYYAFYSVKYAKPPTGPLRFQPPEPVDPWTDVYDGTVEKNSCYQVDSDSGNEDEDCLSVNVYTPMNPEQISTKLPVLVQIHGGGIMGGSGQKKRAGPDFFMDSKSIVIVSINYRLGPFGFFSTGDSIIPGNNGLKDQVLALKWVQTNVAYFGGDPDKVTIYGQSAGGSSIGYLLLSPSAKGLFRAGIVASGTALSPWAYQRNQTDITFKTASLINSEFDSDRDSQKLLSYLQTVDAKAIDDASKNYSDWAQSYSQTGVNGVRNGQLQQGFFYAPVVEVENPNAFLTNGQYESFASGDFNQVPILIGTCADEGLINYNQNINWTLSVYDDNPEFLVPQGMKISDQQTRVLVGNAIKNKYSPDSDMQDNVLSGINYFTEQDFQKSLLRHAELQSNYTDVYFYVFSYDGLLGGNTAKRYPGTSNVTHVEEGNYLWQRVNPTDYPEADQLVHQRMVKLWLNFIIFKYARRLVELYYAEYNNPTPNQDSLLQNITWPKFQVGRSQYVDIGADLQVQSNYKDEMYTFWKNLFEQYGVKPWESF